MYPEFPFQPCDGPCNPGHIKAPQKLLCLVFQRLVPKLLAFPGYIRKKHPYGHAPIVLAALNLQPLSSLTGNGYPMGLQPCGRLIGGLFSVQPADEKPLFQLHLLYASLLQQQLQYLELVVRAVELHLVLIVPCLLCSCPVLLFHETDAFVTLRDNLSQPVFFQETSQLLQIVPDSLKGTLHLCRQILYSHESI